MRPRELVCAALALAALSLSACVRPVAVRAPVLLPAQVPVRAFPTIWVVGGQLAEGDLGARLVAHLAKDGRRAVRRVDVAQLEPLHQAGEISSLTLVVTLEPGIEGRIDERTDVVPVQFCDFYWGCMTQFQSVYSVTPSVVGELLITVYEGPTARVLQTERLQAVVYAEDGPKARGQVVEQLGLQLERAVDVLKSSVQVELEPVEEVQLVQDAIARARAGDWDTGRALLEQAVKQIGGMPRDVVARVWYDLGIARWYAPGPDGLTQSAYEAAKRALALAAERDGRRRYERALETLDRARQRQAVLEEQRRATEHNFALKADSPAAR